MAGQEADLLYDVSSGTAVVVGFSNTLSLLVYGVNEQRWTEQAKAAGQ